MNENGKKLEAHDLMRVSELHFLVHPGFLSNESRAAGYEPELIAEDDAILETYVEQARAMQNIEDAIMIAILPTSWTAIVADTQSDQFIYLKKIREIGALLGKRLIVLTNDFGLAGPHPNPQAFTRIEEIARDQGFLIDESVISYAYGELLEACVDRVAQVLNEQGELVKRTVIKRKLSTAPGNTLNQPDPDNYRIEYD